MEVGVHGVRCNEAQGGLSGITQLVVAAQQRRDRPPDSKKRGIPKHQPHKHPRS